MSAVVVLAGGALGFVSALLSLFLGIGALAAFQLWMAIGLSASALIGVFALLPHRTGLTVKT